MASGITPPTSQNEVELYRVLEQARLLSYYPTFIAQGEICVCCSSVFFASIALHHATVSEAVLSSSPRSVTGRDQNGVCWT